MQRVYRAILAAADARGFAARELQPEVLGGPKRQKLKPRCFHLNDNQRSTDSLAPVDPSASCARVSMFQNAFRQERTLAYATIKLLFGDIAPYYCER